MCTSEWGALALCLSVHLFDSSEEAPVGPQVVAIVWLHDENFFLDLTSTDGSVSISHSGYWLLTVHLLEGQSSPSCLPVHVLV